MQQYPKVYNQTLNDDKDAGAMGLFGSVDDDEDDEEEHTEYADGEEDDKITSKEVVKN